MDIIKLENKETLFIFRGKDPLKELHDEQKIEYLRKFVIKRCNPGQAFYVNLPIDKSYILRDSVDRVCEQIKGLKMVFCSCPVATTSLSIDQSPSISQEIQQKNLRLLQDFKTRNIFVTKIFHKILGDQQMEQILNVPQEMHRHRLLSPWRRQEIKRYKKSKIDEHAKRGRLIAQIIANKILPQQGQSEFEIQSYFDDVIMKDENEENEENTLLNENEENTLLNENEENTLFLKFKTRKSSIILDIYLNGQKTLQISQYGSTISQQYNVDAFCSSFQLRHLLDEIFEILWARRIASKDKNMFEKDDKGVPLCYSSFRLLMPATPVQYERKKQNRVLLYDFIKIKGLRYSSDEAENDDCINLNFDALDCDGRSLNGQGCMTQRVMTCLYNYGVRVKYASPQGLKYITQLARFCQQKNKTCEFGTLKREFVGLFEYKKGLTKRINNAVALYGDVIMKQKSSTAECISIQFQDRQGFKFQCSQDGGCEDVLMVPFRIKNKTLFNLLLVLLAQQARDSKRTFKREVNINTLNYHAINLGQKYVRVLHIKPSQSDFISIQSNDKTQRLCDIMKVFHNEKGFVEMISEMIQEKQNGVAYVQIEQHYHLGLEEFYQLEPLLKLSS